MGKIREFHLFAGIGGGIYGGELLGNECCAGVEIMPYARTVLKQRQADGWMPKFPILPDVTKLAQEVEQGKGYSDVDGKKHKIDFDVLCGGFPCQAFSTAAHGKNIASKNLWDYMFEFVKASNAPVVFGENVVLRAIEKAARDLESVGYKVERIRLSNSDLGADHQRYRFWLLAVKDQTVFRKIARKISKLKKFSGECWTTDPDAQTDGIINKGREWSDRLLGVGNAQSPIVAATAFRILVNRHLDKQARRDAKVSESELAAVYTRKQTWIQTMFPGIGSVHTPTTVANYGCASMQKHRGCRNYISVFCTHRGLGEGDHRPRPTDAEYLMGFPIGASSPQAVSKDKFKCWKGFKND